MSVDSQTPEDLQKLEQYWAAAECGENDDSIDGQPKPPNPDMAWEGAHLCAKSIAALFDYKKIGKLPNNCKPSQKAQLDAARAIIQRQQETDL